MGNLLSVSETFLPTKENIESLAVSIASAVESGNLNPLTAAVQLTAIEKACEAAKEKIRESLLNELAKYGKQTSILGAKIEAAEVGTKWDYSASEAWTSFKEQEDKIAEKRKSIEAMAKNCPEGSELNWTDTDTGETFTIKRGSKTSKSSFKITLGK